MTDPSKKPSKNPGGRPKGVKNKRSWQMRLELEEAGFDPLDEMVKILRITDDIDKKWDRLAWLCRHLYPTLKEVEQIPDMPEDDLNHLSDRSTEDLLALVEKT